jgi:hypothetical protein
MGQRIVRVAVDGALVQLDAARQPARADRLRVVARGQVELVRLGIERAGPRRTERRAAELRDQHLRDALGDLLLHREDVVEALVEAAAPARGAVGRAQQARGHAQPIAPALHGAVEDPLGVELARGRDRVLLGAGETAHRADRSHDEPGRGADPHDQAVGHAELEHFVAVLGDQRLERQDGERRRCRCCRAVVRAAAEDQRRGRDDDGQHTGRSRGDVRPTAMRPRRRDRIGRDRRGRLVGAGRFDRIRRHEGDRPPVAVELDLADRADEAKAAPRHRQHVAVVLVVAERPAQRRQGLAQVVVLDHQAGPEALEQRLAVEQLSRMLDEIQQRVEDARRQLDRAAIGQIAQLASQRVQHEPAERIAVSSVRRHHRPFHLFSRAGIAVSAAVNRFCQRRLPRWRRRTHPEERRP